MDFPDKWAAIVWMCRNQLGRRNLTDAQKTVLIGDAYNAQRMTQGAPKGNQNASKQSRQNGDFEKSGKTEQIIAEKFNVGSGTVSRAKQFVESIDAAEKVSPGFRDSVLTGEVKAPKEVIREIRNIPEEKRQAAVEAIKSGNTAGAKEVIKKL